MLQHTEVACGRGRLGYARGARWLLGIGAVALASCGGGGGHHHAPPPPTVLFEESFDGPFPGAWDIVQPTAAVNAGDGAPAPCVALLGGGSGQPWIEHRPSPPWAWSWEGGIEIFVYACFLEGAAFGAAEIDVLSLDLYAPGVDGTDARVDAQGTAATGVTLTYQILTQGGWVESVETLPPGDGWHDYAYEVRYDGTASWYRDGLERLSTNAESVYDANLGLALRSFFDLDAEFDEILVRRP